MGRTRTFIFLSDYDAQRESGVLTRYSGKDRRAEEIDGSASGYLAVSGKLLYFTDYDPARGQGTLNLYEEGRRRRLIPACGRLWKKRG